jgi:N utilization substance protein B
MSARRIARELAVIVMPQLPKNREKLEAIEVDVLIAKAVHMLQDYGRQILADTDAVITKTASALTDLELEHPSNADKIENLLPVPVDTNFLKTQLTNLERAMNLIAEALDIPEMTMHFGSTTVETHCKKCGETTRAFVQNPEKTEVKEFLERLVQTYYSNKDAIDTFIKDAKAKWQVERMVSIDRDILRLACTEALFMPDIPINVCISEAVELCHRFADEKAARFVNGVLSDLSSRARYFRVHGKFSQEEVSEEKSTGQSSGDKPAAESNHADEAIAEQTT